MALQRRRVLLTAAATAGGLAGCIGGGPPGSGTDAAAAGTGTGTDTTDAGDPGTDGSSPTPDPAAGVGCPSYDRREVERVVCSSDPPEDALVFVPDPERAELPRAAVACRLENDSDEPFETNFHDWTLHKHVDGEWQYLGPYAVVQPLHRLAPGETHVRRLLVDNTDLERVHPPEPEDREDEYETSRHGLGPGAYALALTSSSSGTATAYAAAFNLRGEPVDLVSPGTVVETERDGERRIVHVEPAYEEEVDRYDITVSRRADPPRNPGLSLIDEKLYHPWFVGLRAAFASFESDTRAVEVRGDDSQFTRNSTSGHSPAFVEYRGETFEIEVDPHDG